MSNNKSKVFLNSALPFVGFLVLIFALVSVFQLKIFGPKLKKSVGSKYGGTLVYARGSDTISLDPGNLADGESIKVSMLINQGLVSVVPGTTKVEPCLATEWSNSEDGLEWIFKLRKGVKFHDGTDFNADAVIFTFERQKDKNHPFHEGTFAYWDYMFKNIINITKIDEYTVKFTLDSLHAPILSNLGIFSATIISPSAMNKMGVSGFAKAPVGTGPYKFVEWLPEDRLVLEANEEYWKGRPRLDKIVFRVIKDNTMRFIALDNGEVDIMDGVSPGDIDKIQRNDQLSIIESPGLNIGYMGMNCLEEPFNDKRVRQAINYAINKEPIVKLVYQGAATPAINPIPPNMWGYNDEIVGYEHDFEKAKKLLAEAGYPDGFSVQLDVMDNARTYMPQPHLLAAVIKQNLSVIGIDVNYVIYPWKEHLERGYNGLHKMFLLGWMGDNGDPDNFLYLLLDQDNAVKGSASNATFYRNDELHDILIAARQSPDFDNRVVLYKKAQEIIHDDAPWVPIAHANDIVALNRKVNGVLVQPLFPQVYVENAWIREEE